MKRLKKRFYGIAWIIIILLGLYVGVRGFSMVVFSNMENPLNNVINSLTSLVGKNVMNMYMPGVMQGIVEEEDGISQIIINEVFENYPFYRYLKETSSYETTAESEYTYEMIIAAEAADENYVDHETGELVAKENEQYIDATQENSDSENTDKQNTEAENTNTESDEQNTQANGSNTQDSGNSKDSANTGATEETANTGDTANAEETANAGDTKGIENEDSNTEVAEGGQQSGEDVTANSTAVTSIGTEYSLEKLSDFDFLKNTFYSVDSTTSINSEKLNAQKMLERDMTLQQDSSVPQILIYHTHSQETFADSVAGDTSTTIIGVGEYLAQILANTYGYNVIHNTSTYDMINGKLDRNYAFTLAEPDIKRILQQNPSIQVVIDLHRDGVNENTHLVTNVNGKQTAQFMFFNGLSYNSKVGNIEYLYNPYIDDNLAFSFQMQLQAAKFYPDLTRKIYLKGYRYNLHLMPRATLVEVGGQTNTVEEAKNAMEPLADILNKVLKGN